MTALAPRPRRGAAPAGRFLLVSLALHGSVFGAAALLFHGGPPRGGAPVLLVSRLDGAPEIRDDEDILPPPLELPERVPVEEPLEEVPLPDVRWIPEPEFEPAAVALRDPRGRVPLVPNVAFPDRGDRVGAGTPAAEPDAAPIAAAPVPALTRVSVKTRARLVSCPAPTYPEGARAGGVEGTVRLLVEVLEDGTVGAIEVVEPSGSRALDDAAVEAVRAWRFEPARIDGLAVRVRVRLPAIRYALRG